MFAQTSALFSLPAVPLPAVRAAVPGLRALLGTTKKILFILLLLSRK
jgi:hypothetical protein